MGVLTALVGPSCSGKSTLERELESRGYKRLISFTTRRPRAGEVDGREYYFVSHEQAQELIDSGQTLQHIEFNNQIYGTKLSDMNSLVARDSRAVIVVEPNGVNNIRTRLSERSEYDSVQFQAIYVECVSEILYQRMADRRGSMTYEQYILRLASMTNELQTWPYIARYECHVLNNDKKEFETALVAIERRAAELL